MRPRRIQARALALALAVGLGALLVGLSVAPRVLPGDTLRVTLRATAGATFDVTLPAVGPSYLDGDDALPSFAGGLLATILLAFVLSVAAMSVVRVYERRLRLIGLARPAAGCRGPPPFVNR